MNKSQWEFQEMFRNLRANRERILAQPSRAMASNVSHKEVVTDLNKTKRLVKTNAISLISIFICQLHLTKIKQSFPKIFEGEGVPRPQLDIT